MLYSIRFKELSEYFHRTIDELKQAKYTSLEKLEEKMIKEKPEDESKRNAADVEFIRLTKKYFAMWHILTSFWTETEIIATVSKHMSIRDLVSEYPVREGSLFFEKMLNMCTYFLGVSSTIFKVRRAAFGE